MTRGTINCESPRRAGAGRRPAVPARSRTVEVGGEMEVYWPARTGREGRERRRAVRSVVRTWPAVATAGEVVPTISCPCGEVISNAGKQAVAVVYVNWGGMR
jgi:hypothetical protein